MSDNIIRSPNATQEPSDLYRLTLPQSLHWDSRIANAPRTSRKNHPNNITYNTFGRGRRTLSMLVFRLPHAEHGFPRANMGRSGVPPESVSGVSYGFILFFFLPNVRVYHPASGRHHSTNGLRVDLSWEACLRAWWPVGQDPLVLLLWGSMMEPSIALLLLVANDVCP